MSANHPRKQTVEGGVSRLQGVGETDNRNIYKKDINCDCVPGILLLKRNLLYEVFANQKSLHVSQQAVPLKYKCIINSLWIHHWILCITTQSSREHLVFLLFLFNTLIPKNTFEYQTLLFKCVTLTLDGIFIGTATFLLPSFQLLTVKYPTRIF